MTFARKMILGLASLLVLVGASGCAGPKLVAKVDGEPVTQDEFYQALQRYAPPSMTGQPSSPAGEVVLRNLIVQAALEKKAAKSGIKVTDAEVNRRLEEVKERSLQSDLSWEEYLRRSYTSESELRKQIRFQVIAGRLLVTDKERKEFFERTEGVIAEGEGGLRGKADVTVKTFRGGKPGTIEFGPGYQKNKAEIAKDPRLQEAVLLRRIIVASKAEAEAIRKQVADGTPFVKLAKEKSLVPYERQRGGMVGWVYKGMPQLQGQPEFEKAAFTLKPGQMSEPMEIESSGAEPEKRPLPPNYQVLMVEKRRAAKPVTLENAEDIINDQIISQKGMQAMEFGSSTLAEAQIEIIDPVYSPLGEQLKQLREEQAKRGTAQPIFPEEGGRGASGKPGPGAEKQTVPPAQKATPKGK